MPKATTVHLPFGKQPAFPPGCAGCGNPDPGPPVETEVTVDKDYTGSPEMTIQVPCCKACRWQATRWSLTRTALIVVVFLTFPLAGWVTALAARPFWEPLTGSLPQLVIAIPFVLVAVGAVAGGWRGVGWLMNQVSPPFAVELAKDHSVEYRFRDPSRAAAFAELNAAREPRRPSEE